MTEATREIIAKHKSNDSFMYMILDRMRMDCNYFLGSGKNEANKVSKLWSGSIDGIIEDMKAIYNNFGEDERPEWLTMEQIEEYEAQMKEGAK